MITSGVEFDIFREYKNFVLTMILETPILTVLFPHLATHFMDKQLIGFACCFLGTRAAEEGLL